MTSCYSGTGAFECATKMVWDKAAEELGLPKTPKVVFYSACDIDPVARAALAAHSAPTKPLHIFGEILDRIPRGSLADLKTIEAHYFDLWSATKQECKSGDTSKKDFESWRSRIEDEYLKELVTRFAAIEFQEDAYCFVHERMCPVCPRAGGSPYKDFIWGEAAGTTCCPWSRMHSGGQNKWFVHIRPPPPASPTHESKG